MTEETYWTKPGRRIPRRRMIQGAGLTGLGLVGAALVGCGDEDEGDSGSGGGGAGGSTGTAGSGGGDSSSTASSGGGGGGSVVDPRTGNALDGVRYGGTLNLDHADEAITLYNHIEEAPGSVHAAQPVYEQLITRYEDYAAEAGRVWESPGLAQEWEIEDELAWRFKLQPGVTWHNIEPVNGRPFSSEDVAYSIELMKGENDPRVRMRSVFSVVDSIETPDEETVIVRTSEPYASLATNLGHTWSVIVPRELVESGEIETRAIGTGPFIFDEWRRGVETRYVRNEDYWRDGFPFVDELVLHWTPDSAARMSDFRTDATPYWSTGYTSTPPETVRGLADSVPGTTMHEYYGTSGFRAAFNCEAEPFNDERVRQAALYGVDYDRAIELFGGYGRRYAIFSLDNLVWGPTEDMLPGYEPQRAADLMSAAGFSVDSPASVQTSVSQYYSGPAVSQVAQELLRPVGFNVEINLMENAQWVADVYRGGAPFQMTSHSDWTWEDADRGLFTYFHSQGAQNNVHYSNPETDSLLERQRGIFEEEERKEVVNQAITQIIADAPQAWWLVTGGAWLERDTLHNFRYMTHGNANLYRQWGYVWLDE